MTVRIPAPLDAYARAKIATRPHSIVAWWLMASYVYYHADGALLSDGYYDELCRELLARWDAIEHPHKHLIDRGELEAGTGYYIAEAAYPRMTVNAAALLMSRGALPEDEPADPEPEAETPGEQHGEQVTQMELF